MKNFHTQCQVSRKPNNTIQRELVPYHLRIQQQKDSSQAKPVRKELSQDEQWKYIDRKIYKAKIKHQLLVIFFGAKWLYIKYVKIIKKFQNSHTSCSSNRESKVFLDEVMRSEYAVLTPSSELQNEDLTGSCRQSIIFRHYV